MTFEDRQRYFNFIDRYRHRAAPGSSYHFEEVVKFATFQPAKVGLRSCLKIRVDSSERPFWESVYTFFDSAVVPLSPAEKEQVRIAGSKFWDQRIKDKVKRRKREGGSSSSSSAWQGSGVSYQ